METVDVLCDEGEKFAAPLELDKRAVSRVRFRRPSRMMQAALPGELPHLRIGHVVPNVRETLGFRISGPDALWPPKVRNAGLGGNAGAGQSHDAAGGLKPLVHIARQLADDFGLPARRDSKIGRAHV